MLSTRFNCENIILFFSYPLPFLFLPHFYIFTLFVLLCHPFPPGSLIPVSCFVTSLGTADLVQSGK